MLNRSTRSGMIFEHSVYDHVFESFIHETSFIRRSMSRQRHPLIPDQIVTSRLILRPLDRGDARAYGRMIGDRRMWTFLTPAYWRRGTRYRIRRWGQLIRSQEAYHFIIRTRDENEFVGEVA